MRKKHNWEEICYLSDFVFPGCAQFQALMSPTCSLSCLLSLAAVRISHPYPKSEVTTRLHHSFLPTHALFYPYVPSSSSGWHRSLLWIPTQLTTTHWQPCLPLLLCDLSCCLRSLQAGSPPATSALARNLLEMQTLTTSLNPTSELLNQQLWGWGYNKASRRFCCRQVCTPLMQIISVFPRVLLSNGKSLLLNKINGLEYTSNSS